jgi:hypothetical protein
MLSQQSKSEEKEKKKWTENVKKISFLARMHIRHPLKATKNSPHDCFVYFPFAFGCLKATQHKQQ